MNYFLFIVRRPWLVLVPALAVTAAAVFAVSGLGFDDSIERWFLETDPALAAYENYREEFGNDEYIRVAYVADGDALGEKNLALDAVLTETFAGMDVIIDVDSLTSSEEIRSDGDLLEVGPLITSAPGTEERRRLMHELTTDPLYRGRLISPDGRYAAITLRVAHRPGANILENAALEIALRKVPEDLGVEYFMSGSIVWNVTFFKALQRDQTTLIPAMLGVFIIVLGFLFRNVVGVVLPSATVVAAVLWTFGLMGAVGLSLQAVTGFVPIVLLAIGIADSVHLLSEFQEKLAAGHDKASSIVRASMAVLMPCLFTSVTTALGFLGLLVIEVAPLRTFGIFSAIGTMFAFFATFTIMPAVLALLPVPRKYRAIQGRDTLSPQASAPATTSEEDEEDIGMPELAVVFDFVSRHRTAFVLGSLGVLIAGLAGLPQVRTVVNFYEYLDPDHPAIVATDTIENNVGGAAIIEALVVPRKAADGSDAVEPIKNVETLKELARLQVELEENPYVESTLSPVTFVEAMNQKFSGGSEEARRVPDSREAVGQLLLMYEMDAPDGELYDFVNFDFTLGRLIATSHSKWGHSHAGIIKIMEATNETSNYLSIQPTGTYALVTRMEWYLLIGMITGLSVAFAAVTLVIVALFRSFKHGAIAMIPSLLPVVVVVGATGWIGFSITAMPTMMGNVALGIAVDNAIHLLTRYRRLRARDFSVAAAMRRSVIVVGRPVLVTTVVLVLGFLIMLGSEMVDGRRFGMLAAATLSCSLLASLLTLPATVLFFDGRFGPSPEPVGDKAVPSPAPLDEAVRA